MVLDVDVDGSGEIDFEVIASAGAAGKLLDEHIFVFGSVCVLLTLLKKSSCICDLQYFQL